MLDDMGQNSSTSPCLNFPKPKRKLPRFLSKSKSGRMNLSHTFSLPNDNETYYHLNVNLATEEELMSLSGITRDVARRIVKHRQAIGRFRRVDDLALVAGIGADKLDKLRGEVCVKTNSCSSSRAQSVDSLKSNDIRVPKLVDINKANVFELQCLNGINQEMAANIVHYRNKRGPFKKIDDLVKVRSINHPKLSNISHQLTISDDDSDLSRTTSASETLNVNSNANNVNSEATNGSPTKYQRNAHSAPVKFQVPNGMPSASSLGDIYDLLSAYSHRPVLDEEFKYVRNGHDAVRIATWNLYRLTVEKAENLGVREVVCRTILENRWSLVGIQDVIDEEAIKLICDELNAPKLRKVCECRCNSYEWNYVMNKNSKLAIIYDKFSGGIGLQVLENGLQKSSFSQLTQCTIGLRSFIFANVQISDESESNQLIGQIESVEQQFRSNNNNNEKLLILGDFGELAPANLDHLFPIVPVNANTGLCNVTCNDNIFVFKNTKNILTGKFKMIQHGLTHLAIPNGWSWGGPVSPHCPIWAEIYVNAPLQNGF